MTITLEKARKSQSNAKSMQGMAVWHEDHAKIFKPQATPEGQRMFMMHARTARECRIIAAVKTIDADERLAGNISAPGFLVYYNLKDGDGDFLTRGELINCTEDEAHEVFMDHVNRDMIMHDARAYGLATDKHPIMVRIAPSRPGVPVFGCAYDGIFPDLSRKFRELLK